MPPTSSASAAPGVGMPQARLPPLQQGISFQGGPAAGPVPADWARAYREQQHKAAQVHPIPACRPVSTRKLVLDRDL